MADVDALFDVFGDTTESTSSVPLPITKPASKNEDKSGETSSATEILKRRREEAKESHGEETKKLKIAIVDELR